MRVLNLICAGTLLTAPLGAAEQDRTLTLPVSGSPVMRIEAGAGFLKVVSRPGQKDIQVQAHCVVEGKPQDLQDRVDLTLVDTPKGPQLIARLREARGLARWFRFGGGDNRIDLTVTVPTGVGLSIVDGSGDLEVRGVRGLLDITDGSGDLRVEDIQGQVRIHDGSGDLHVKGIIGTLEVIDGSGDMWIKDVTGAVTVTDGSGDIDIANVQGDVRLKGTGSGAVRTRDIKGRILN